MTLSENGFPVNKLIRRSKEIVGSGLTKVTERADEPSRAGNLRSTTHRSSHHHNLFFQGDFWEETERVFGRKSAVFKEVRVANVSVMPLETFP